MTVFEIQSLITMNDPYPNLPHRLKNYVLNSVLGKGGFAFVYKAVNVFYNVEFAVKVITPPKEGYDRILRSFDAEVNALVKLDHPNVIRLYDFFSEDDHLFLVLEFCSRGTLENKISSGEIIPDPMKFKICSQILSALKYCYDQSISHRDIKASNILFDSNGRVKVADFGLSELIGHDENFNEFNGSLCYASPEICRKLAHNPFKSDVWSLGVLFYRLFTYSYPFNGRTKSELKDRIVEGFYSEKIQGPVGKIIRKMLTVDPENRITIDQLNEMELFKSPSQRTVSFNMVGCPNTKSYRILQPKPNLIQTASSKRRYSLQYLISDFPQKPAQNIGTARCINLISHNTFTTSPNCNEK